MGPLLVNFHMYSIIFSQRLTRYIIIILDLHQSNPTIFLQPGQTMASLRFNGAKIWNSIDESYKEFSTNKFKKQLESNMINFY